MENKVFHYNENGICMNPNVLTIKSGKYSAMVEVACSGGKWRYGCYLSAPTYGMSGGVSNKYGDSFDTEAQAMAEVAKIAINYFSNDKNVPKFIFTELKKLLHPKPIQLSLFGDF